MSQEMFDPKVLEPATGIRAVWLLYKSGQWGYLEDFGLTRAENESKLRRFEKDNVVDGNRLTDGQCGKLVKAIPGVEYAAKELQLAYALKFPDESMQLIDKEQSDAGVVSRGRSSNNRGKPDRGIQAGE